MEELTKDARLDCVKEASELIRLAFDGTSQSCKAKDMYVELEEMASKLTVNKFGLVE